MIAKLNKSNIVFLLNEDEKFSLLTKYKKCNTEKKEPAVNNYIQFHNGIEKVVNENKHLQRNKNQHSDKQNYFNFLQFPYYI
jgi:hypothetical protein